MKVIVLGSGVIGVTCAYQLAAAGHEVTVLDRQPAAALETSYGNAGEVSPGYSAPWAGPGVPLKAVKWLLMHHRPLVIRPHLDMNLVRWGVAMLRNCTAARYEVNKSRMVRLAEYSRDCLRELRAQTGIRYDERMQGTLQLFRTQAQLDGTAADIAILKRYGVGFELLDMDGCIRHEPALARTREKFVGGLLLPGDETGDCFKFTQNLAALAVQRGVQFRYGTQIKRLSLAGKQIDGVVTDTGTLKADAYLVATGQLLAAAAQAAGHSHPGLPGQGLLHHRAHHRRLRRARIHRDGRNAQGGRHAPGRAHPRGWHGRAGRLHPPAARRAPPDAGARGDRSVPERR